MKGEIDDILRRAVDTGDVPGVVAVIVDAEGVRYEGAAGERAAGSGRAMTVDTVGAIQSMTKAVTGVAAMRLVEQGYLDLDAPADRVCRELADVEVLVGFDADGRPVTRPRATEITLRNLLTHTSGFAYEFWNADLLRYLEVTGAPRLAARSVAALIQPLTSDPGTRWEYGIGIDWAGQMIERVTGERLGDHVAEHIFAPLAMTDTAYRPRPTMVERAASLHLRQGDGSLVVVPSPPPPDDAIDLGGGGLHGTMPDYARFLRMILNGGELDGRRVLAADTVDDMTRNHIGDLRVQPMPSTNPVLSEDAEFFPGTPKSWGLTWQIDEQAQQTGRPAGTLMWAGLHNSFFWIDRRNDLAGCFLTQLLPFVDHRAVATFHAVESAAYAAH